MPSIARHPQVGDQQIDRRSRSSSVSACCALADAGHPHAGTPARSTRSIDPPARWIVVHEQDVPSLALVLGHIRSIE
jgi:hypothetical protein